MHHFKSLKHPTVAFEGFVTLQKSLLNRLASEELNVSDSFAFIAFRILDDSNIGNFTTTLFDEELPDVLFFRLEW